MPNANNLGCAAEQRACSMWTELHCTLPRTQLLLRGPGPHLKPKAGSGPLTETEKLLVSTQTATGDRGCSSTTHSTTPRQVAHQKSFFKPEHRDGATVSLVPTGMDIFTALRRQIRTPEGHSRPALVVNSKHPNGFGMTDLALYTMSPKAE
ncbi:hypothetical protein P7K49_012772 [Saguinus oedipus]|uniref:Uncharacterized protein n=1 Tax=Saguinus oedipus TaxID=9490 RepID=A0ABQ9VEE8_SAGOE|nr:hypothetical protein P7K49_012772 [Saguinus oedipus]